MFIISLLGTARYSMVLKIVIDAWRVSLGFGMHIAWLPLPVFCSNPHWGEEKDPLSACPWFWINVYCFLKNQSNHYKSDSGIEANPS